MSHPGKDNMANSPSDSPSSGATLHGAGRRYPDYSGISIIGARIQIYDRLRTQNTEMAADLVLCSPAPRLMAARAKDLWVRGQIRQPRSESGLLWICGIFEDSFFTIEEALRKILHCSNIDVWIVSVSTELHFG